MGNVIMKAQQITYGASNVEKALDDLKAPELIELNKRMAAIDEWKANVHEVTYTGSELTIENALALPARSLVTTIEAVQDLHGQSAPYVGGVGKNKLPLILSDIKANNTAGTWNGNVYSIAGGTIEVLTDSDGNVTGFKVNGTFNAAVTFLVCNYSIALTADTFIFTCGKSDDDPVGDSTTSSEFFGFISGVNGAAQWLASTIPAVQRTFTVTDTSKLIRFAIYVASGKSVSNQILYPMIRKSTDATGFAPWENKCPISGRTAVVLTRSDGDEISEDFTIQLGTTVYGGEVNWDTGICTVNRILKELTWGSLGKTVIGNYTRGSVAIESAADYAVYPPTVGRPQVSNLAPYKAAFSEDSLHFYISTDRIQVFLPSDTDNSTVIQLSYELVTPTTIQLTHTQLELLKGYNRVSVNDGYATIELKVLVLGGDD